MNLCPSFRLSPIPYNRTNGRQVSPNAKSVAFDLSLEEHDLRSLDRSTLLNALQRSINARSTLDQRLINAASDPLFHR
eukprot:276112-Prorocentrum_minimum.AAC.3